MGEAMKKTASLLGIVLALGIGYYVFKMQFQQQPGGAAPPQQQIDVVGVKNDLIAIAQAERLYLASNGMYATLEQLQQDGSLTFSPVNRRGYSYVAEVDGGLHFRIIARPSDPAKQDWPSLSIDETMQIVQQ